MKKRYPLPDALRGVMILAVIFHHLCIDLNRFCGMRFPFMESGAFLFLRECVLWGFFVLSGVSSSFSQNTIYNSIRTLTAAFAVSAATYLFPAAGVIRFGVLHCLGTCRLLWALTAERRRMRRPLLSAAAAAVAALIVRPLPTGVLYLPFLGEVHTGEFLGLGWLGLCDSGFYSADYFPLLVWLPVFSVGGFLGKHWQQRGFPAAFDKNPSPLLSMIGRRTLPFYLLHQPVILLALAVFGKLGVSVS